MVYRIYIKYKFLTCSWLNCALVGHEYQTHEALYQSNLYPCHK